MILTDEEEELVEVLDQFVLTPWVGMDPFDEAKLPQMRISLTHQGCEGYRCSFPSLPYQLPVGVLLKEVMDHIEQHHPELNQ
jgi:hypothetical protein